MQRSISSRNFNTIRKNYKNFRVTSGRYARRIWGHILDKAHFATASKSLSRRWTQLDSRTPPCFSRHNPRLRSLSCQKAQRARKSPQREQPLWVGEAEEPAGWGRLKAKAERRRARRGKSLLESLLRSPAECSRQPDPMDTATMLRYWLTLICLLRLTNHGFFSKMTDSD